MKQARERLKHVPERTCVACRQKKPKGELIRIVRTPQGSIELDISARKSGRGTYICKQRVCWDALFQKKKLESALKTDIIAEQRNELIAYGKSLPAVIEDK